MSEDIVQQQQDMAPFALHSLVELLTSGDGILKESCIGNSVMVTLRGKKAYTSVKTRPVREKSTATSKKNSTRAKKRLDAITKQANKEIVPSETSNRFASLSKEDQWIRLMRFLVRSTLFLNSTASLQAMELESCTKLSSHRRGSQGSNKAKCAQDTVKTKTADDASPIQFLCDTLLVAQCLAPKETHLHAHQIIDKMERSTRKRICGEVFGADEIAYSCRDCQVDPTCVICNDCFLRSDHTGHTVHFQRTAAGSSCDCGDPQAWKRNGFCCNHAGMDALDASTVDGRIWIDALKFDGKTGKTFSKWSKQLHLSETMCQNAFEVIDSVIDHVHQTLIGIEYAFELAEAFELFSRGIHNKAIVSTIEHTTSVSPTGSNDHTQEREDYQVKPTLHRSGQGKKALKNTDGGQFYIRIHNDDVHTYHKVANTLSTTFQLSESVSTRVVDAIDRHGDAIIRQNFHILECPYPAAECVWATLNVSVAPAWLDHQIVQLGSLLDWLYKLIRRSDGYDVLVTHALCKPRKALLRTIDEISTMFDTDTTLPDLIKAGGFRMHQQTRSVFEKMIGRKSVHSWAHDIEKQIRSRYDFFGTKSFQELANGPTICSKEKVQELRCNNHFVSSFVEHLAETPEEALQTDPVNVKKIRDGCEAILQHYYVDRHKEAPFYSTLELLMRYDAVFRKGTSENLHRILRELLLCSSIFRDKMLKNYLYAYKPMTKFYLQGLGNSNETIFDFAVQFLTDSKLVQKYTKDAIRQEDDQYKEEKSTILIPHRRRPEIIKVFLDALHATLLIAAQPKGDTGENIVIAGSLDPDLTVISNQKYKHCVDNLEYVLNVGEISNEVICVEENLRLWLSCLRILQNGDAERRRGPWETHVEYESDTWLSMFNLGIRMHSIFPVAWRCFGATALRQYETTLPQIIKVITSVVLSTCKELHAGIKDKHILPVYTIASRLDPSSESGFLTHRIDYSSFKVSMHVPLHRLLACAIRRVCIYDVDFSHSLDQHGLLAALGLNELTVDECVELVEAPLRCLVMASQIQSNLWRRNGDENMMAQLYNYSALPYCIHYRDADVFMMQLGVLILGAESIMARIMDRFGIAAYFARGGSDEAVSSFDPEECCKALGYHTLTSDAIDSQRYLQLVEEFLRLIITVGTALPCSTGTEYEQSFLKQEMLQQLCAKSYPFSRLFELAILPSGHDDISTSRLEDILSQIADFNPPLGLEPGRYSLKPGLLEEYNPYFLHLNRESHEMARDRWTTFRVQQRQETHDSTNARPVFPPPRPISFLAPVQDILTCRSTMTIIGTILERALSSDSVRTQQAPAIFGVSDGVLTTTLHILAFSIDVLVISQQKAGSPDILFDQLFTSAYASKSSLVELLVLLYSRGTSLLDADQLEVVEWTLKFVSDNSSQCKVSIQEMTEKLTINNIAGIETHEQACTPASESMHDRKEAARKRVLDVIAKQQASFQLLMSEDVVRSQEDSDNEDETMDCLTPQSESVERKMTRKRQNEVANDTVTDMEQQTKRHKSVIKLKCILCHDSSKQAEMGVAALVHQSTVMSGSFRPDPSVALQADGAKARAKIKKLIEKIGFCSGSESLLSHNFGSEADMRAFGSPLEDWISRGVPEDGFALDTDRSIEYLPAIESLETETNTANGRVMLIEAGMDDFVIEGAESGESAGSPPIELPRPPAIRRAERQTARTNRQRNMAAGDDGVDRIGTVSVRRITVSHSPTKLYLRPCGLHIRTCQHAVHRSCLDGYIRCLHEKATRGEEFDGVQAIDPDSAMMQFLCPLCKTISNLLIPTSDFHTFENKDVSRNKIQDPVASRRKINLASGSAHWYDILQEQATFTNWYRVVFGRDGACNDNEPSLVEHEKWRDYFEQTLWEPHGSLEKGAPYLWSACAYSIASFSRLVEEEFRNVTGGEEIFDPLVHPCPSSLKKEMHSLTLTTKFCRWSFTLLEHSEDAKIIWETAKRCSPLHYETKRDHNKFTKVLGTIDACLRGTIWGLLVADNFTAFVVASVLSLKLEKIGLSIPLFAAADLLQRLHLEFFSHDECDANIFLQDSLNIASNEASDSDERASTGTTRMQTRRMKSHPPKAPSKSKLIQSLETTTALVQAKLDSIDTNENTEDFVTILQMLSRIACMFPDQKLKSRGLSNFESRVSRIIQSNQLLVRRMKLFWRCLFVETQWSESMRQLVTVPSMKEIAQSPDDVLTQLWRWCVDRRSNQQYLSVANKREVCEHTEDCGDSYTASMFILRENLFKPQLVHLPIQYDKLYSQYMGQKCERCDKVPTEAGLCLVCGQYLCCGDSCCETPYMLDGPPVGECTRHAAECGGGVGIVLLLDQCRVVIIAGSMAAYFPSPYVDAHGEEDIGLQRGRPLRLDMARYRHLDSLWVNHRIFSEVSRQRNLCDPQYAINLSYL
uniref:E3 ubiquitin-protein ligase n=1 Tax=Albugo laibachii Nc14 TaxID=890382 RepID=F0W4I8_9STRA|nr:conserved hypothetical protein [Albugo laibachii Nc14]|eukprot:CCA16021.1 conserved hypothetical protein [Albugo laibachii Nc14]